MQTHVSTEAAARLFNVQPNTLRASLCRQGHYLGIRPRKLPNRLLAWPLEDISRVMQGEDATKTAPDPEMQTEQHAKASK